MAASSLRARSIIDGINVTPLVDITLVLLVTVMVVAKIADTTTIPLDLPRAAKAEATQSVLVIQIDAEGSLVQAGQPRSLEELRELGRQAALRDPELRCVIEADKAVPHGRIIAVLDVLRTVGMTRVAFGVDDTVEKANR